jgi:hypothetical protein
MKGRSIAVLQSPHVVKIDSCNLDEKGLSKRAYSMHYKHGLHVFPGFCHGLIASNKYKL